MDADLAAPERPFARTFFAAVMRFGAAALRAPSDSIVASFCGHEMTSKE
jgi:hypothetical protein